MLVSVIIPTYNHAKFISKTINSLISQTYTNWEAIIINDGSSDNSDKLINSLISHDSRFQYFTQKNIGIFNLHKTYNKALSLSRGEIIAVLEGDDFWPPNKLEIQVPEFSDPAVGLVWGDGIIYLSEQDQRYAQGYVGSINDDTLNNIPIGSALRPIIFGKIMTMPSCAVMYKKSALLSINGFYQPHLCKWLDRPTWALLSLKHSFTYIKKNLCYYRIHSNQVTKNYKKTNTKFTFDYCLADKKCPPELIGEIKKYRFYLYWYYKLRIIKEHVKKFFESKLITIRKNSKND